MPPRPSGALRHAFAKYIDRPAAALDHATVIKVIDGIAGAGSAPIAGRTLAYGRACYGWAVARRKLPMNPFAGLPQVQGSAPARDRVLTAAEVGAIWRAALRLGTPFGPLVRVMLLTGQRREEVAGMRWLEISDNGDGTGTWTIPAERAKNGRAHVMHLPPTAWTILQSVERVDGQDLVFSTTGTTPPSGFSKAKAALDRIVTTDGVAEPWRYHDFRRSMVTWLAGAGFPPHVADRLLNHVGGTINGVAAVYQRAEFLAERKAALEAWATHVLQCGEGVLPAHNVVALRAEGRGVSDMETAASAENSNAVSFGFTVEQVKALLEQHVFRPKGPYAGLQMPGADSLTELTSALNAEYYLHRGQVEYRAKTLTLNARFDKAYSEMEYVLDLIISKGKDAIEDTKERIDRLSDVVLKSSKDEIEIDDENIIISKGQLQNQKYVFESLISEREDLYNLSSAMDAVRQHISLLILAIRFFPFMEMPHWIRGKVMPTRLIFTYAPRS